MPRAEIFSTFQMLAKIRRGHAGVVTEKAAEMKFAGEIELAGNVLDGKPFVSAQPRRCPLAPPSAKYLLFPRGAGRFAPGFLPGTARIVLFAAKTGGIFLFSFNGNFL
jgi:hypothetical protein